MLTQLGLAVVLMVAGAATAVAAGDQDQAEGGEAIPPATGPPAPVPPVPLQSTVPEQYCREYTMVATIAGRQQQIVGIACLRPDGTWEIAGAPAPLR